MPSSIQSILNERHVEEIDWKQDKKNDTATFYSISSSQKGEDVYSKLLHFIFNI